MFIGKLAEKYGKIEETIFRAGFHQGKCLYWMSIVQDIWFADAIVMFHFWTICSIRPTRDILSTQHLFIILSLFVPLMFMETGKVDKITHQSVA